MQNYVKTKYTLKLLIKGKKKTWKICLLLDNELMHTVSHPFTLMLVGMKSEERLVSLYLQCGVQPSSV